MTPSRGRGRQKSETISNAKKHIERNLVRGCGCEMFGDEQDSAMVWRCVTILQVSCQRCDLSQ
eukprot:4801999-Amphidinium_carterae.1